MLILWIIRRRKKKGERERARERASERERCGGRIVEIGVKK
jgi:hypothetical protein